MCFFVFIFRNLLWGSVNYGQSLHGLHNTKSLRTPDLHHSKKDLMEQVVYTFWEKRSTCFATIKGDFVFSAHIHHKNPEDIAVH